MRTVLVLPLVSVLLLGPGLLPALAIARRCRLAFVEALPLALAITVGFVGIGGWLAWSLKLGLRAALVFLVIFSIAVSAILIFGGERPWARPFGRTGGVLMLLAAAVSLLGGAWLGFHGDVFFHLAAPRALLATNAPLVTDPLYGVKGLGPDPTAGIWHTTLALLSLVTSVDVVNIWFAVSVLVAGLVVGAFYALCRQVCGSPAPAAIGALLLVATGGFDFRSGAYPNMAARIFLFTMMTYFVIVARGDRRVAIYGAVAGGAAGTFMHMAFAQMTYVFVAVACVAALLGSWLARRRDSGQSWSPLIHTLYAAGAIVVITAPSVVVRARSVLGSWMTGSSGYSVSSAFPNTPSVGLMFPGVGLKLAPAVSGALSLALGLASIAVLALMLVAAVRDRRPERFAHVAVASTSFLLYQFPPVTLTGLALAPYVLYRLQTLTSYVRPLQVSWAIGPSSRPTPAARWIGYAMLAVILALSIPLAVQKWTGVAVAVRPEPTIAESWSKDVRWMWSAAAVDKMRRLAGNAYPRVGSDPVTGYELAGVAPVSTLWVPETHNPLAILATNAKQREQASKRLMDPALSEADRLALAREWGLDYIAVSNESPKRAALLAALERQSAFEPVLQSKRLAVFKVGSSH
jgi:hypothetical protein